jgi:predicted NBD/HSP70 family sugar kinase
MKKNARNSAYTKIYNRKLLLNIILKRNASRAELARNTGLTRAAVSIIIDELISEGIVIEKGTVETELGRKPVMLDINPDSFYALGLDISRTGCSLGLVNIKGKLITRQSIDISNVSKASEAIDRIAKQINKLISKIDIDKEKILGLGICTPGPIDTVNGKILNPPNFKLWNNLNIVELFKEHFDFEIHVNNSSSALALAEKYYGLGRKFSDFILLVVTTGIGSAIVMNHKLYRGKKGSGVEIGHTTIDYNGKLCQCGNVGCLELYASTPAIVNKAKEHDHNIETWNQIVDKALEGDETCLKIIDKEAKYLATGIINTINILEIDSIVLTGHINYKPQLLVKQIEKYVNNQAIHKTIRKANIYIAEIKEDTDVIAPATTIFDTLIFGG